MTDKQTLAQSLRRYGSDFISHPVSRGIEDIEAAGELMLEAARVLAEQPAGPDAEPAIPPGYKLVPVEPTPAMLVAINWPNDPAGYRAMLAAAPEAPQPAAAVSVKPVAWVDITDEGQIVSSPRMYSDGSREERPLYTAPQPAKPPPLAIWQIAAAVEQCKADVEGEFLVEFARAIERAHGIGEQT